MPLVSRVVVFFPSDYRGPIPFGACALFSVGLSFLRLISRTEIVKNLVNASSLLPRRSYLVVEPFFDPLQIAK